MDSFDTRSFWELIKTLRSLSGPSLFEIVTGTIASIAGLTSLTYALYNTYVLNRQLQLMQEQSRQAQEQSKLMYAQHIASMGAKLIVDIELRQTVAGIINSTRQFLVIANTGADLAANIRITFDTPVTFYRLDGGDRMEIYIPSLAPNSSLEWYISVQDQNMTIGWLFDDSYRSNVGGTRILEPINFS